MIYGLKRTSVVRSSGSAILGQGMAFLALLCPIIFGHHQQLALIVFISSVATIVSPVLGLGVPQVGPVLKNPSAAYAVAWFTLWLLVSVALIASIVLKSVFENPAYSLFTAGTCLAAGQAAYSINLSSAVRSGNLTKIGFGRLALGATALGSALVASFLEEAHFYTSLEPH